MIAEWEPGTMWAAGVAQGPSGTGRGPVSPAESATQPTMPAGTSTRLTEAPRWPKEATEPCYRWPGRRHQLQAAAWQSLIDAGRAPSHWSWVSPTCGTSDCVLADHLVVHSPTRIDYPAGLCVYCGIPGFTRDHLVPSPVSGHVARTIIATVPSCGECNGLLLNEMTYSITERRHVAHVRLRKRYRSALRTKDFCEEELAGFGHGLRGSVEAAMRMKVDVLRRLRWPVDPVYDERAFQKSGIDDPYAAGLVGWFTEVAS